MAWLTRFLAAVAFLAIGVIFSPEIFGSKSDSSNSIKLSTYLKLAHLLSFSTAFGAALWVTFIGGIIMFKNLPRHQFGNLQSKMFPAYFSTVGICCAISVASFGYLHPWKSSSTAERYQLGFLLSSFAFNLANLFVFTPMTIEGSENNADVEDLKLLRITIWHGNFKIQKKPPFSTSSSHLEDKVKLQGKGNDRVAKLLRPIGANYKENDRRGQNKNCWVKRLHYGSWPKGKRSDIGVGSRGSDFVTFWVLSSSILLREGVQSFGK